MKSLVALLLLLLLVPGTAAYAYEVTVGTGRVHDAVPSHFEEAMHVTLAFQVQVQEDNETLVPVGNPGDAATAMEPFCSCGSAEIRSTPEGTFLVVPAGTSGDATAGVVRMLGPGDAYVYEWSPPQGPVDDVAIHLQAAADHAVLASFDDRTFRQDGGQVRTFDDDALRTAPATFAVLPSSLVPVPQDVTGTVQPGPDQGRTSTDWITLLGAFVAGILLWALLVQRGAVQKRSRKQVVSQATHKVEAQAPRSVLEARKRTLMAGLKDLEKAKIQGEVEPAAYDTVKADLKGQAVTVMRALEEQGKA